MRRGRLLVVVAGVLLVGSCGGDATEDVVGRQTGSREAPVTTAAADAPTPTGQTGAKPPGAQQPATQQQAPAAGGTSSGAGAPAKTAPPTTAPYDPEESPGGPDAPDVPYPGAPGY